MAPSSTSTARAKASVANEGSSAPPSMSGNATTPVRFPVADWSAGEPTTTVPLGSSDRTVEGSGAGLSFAHLHGDAHLTGPASPRSPIGVMFMAGSAISSNPMD